MFIFGQYFETEVSVLKIEDLTQFEAAKFALYCLLTPGNL